MFTAHMYIDICVEGHELRACVCVCVFGDVFTYASVYVPAILIDRATCHTFWLHTTIPLLVDSPVEIA